ncbi:hypothetical protein [Brevundimonas sp.]|jgi:hypothetical protein|uniref:hypothetical protein n=1 Tax=Brevundimonas sp. TaxID=1871086 RepID=UPI0037C16864
MFVATLLTLAVLIPDTGAPRFWEQPGSSISWARAPDPEVTVALMPGFAARMDLEGWARIGCYQAVDGHPYNCRVVDERPYGVGFGAAARVIVASGELKLGRVAGLPAPGQMQTTVRFRLQQDDGDAWTGPEPSPAQMRLARQLVDRAYENGAPDDDDPLDGLDYDRREVVQAWADELFAETRAGRREAMALQLARVATEADLRRLLAGEYVPMPDPEVFASAAPESEKERAAIAELRRRYCERYSCDATETRTGK